MTTSPVPAELRAKAESSIGSDTHRIKHNFAAGVIDKLIEEIGKL